MSKLTLVDYKIITLVTLWIILSRCIETIIMTSF
jgi:hypothetical protein